MAGLYTQQLEQHLQQFEQTLSAYLPTDGTLQDTVVHAMAYACEGGGKRIRPVLLMEFCRLCCGDASRALPFAAAIEMIHSYSLVHDDMPCMDNSPTRRGKPSVHAVYGEAMALLTGDALLNRAFETVLNVKNTPQVSAEATVTAAAALADFAGIHGMIGGQVIDLECEGKTIDEITLKQLQEGKTAALIRAACQMGCAVGGGDEARKEAADRFGYDLGLCFQVVDDILDVTATEAQLGKPVGSDEANEKNTYVSFLGLEGAKQLAEEYTNRAVQALAVFGEAAEDLVALATALLHRAN